jgi:hypothetical protein
MRDKATEEDNNVVKCESFRGVAPKRFRYIFRKFKENRKVGEKVVECNPALLLLENSIFIKTI